MVVKMIDFGGKVPMRAHYNDAGADVYTNAPATIPPHTTVRIPLGFGLELPDGYAAYVYPRSGMSLAGLTCELPPIDSGYRGEVHAIVSNLKDTDAIIEKGTRIGQLVMMPVVIPELVRYQSLNERGDGAFGSTGDR